MAPAKKRGSHSFLKTFVQFFLKLHISHEMQNLIFKDKEKVFPRLSFQKSRYVTFLCNKIKQCNTCIKLLYYWIRSLGALRAPTFIWAQNNFFFLLAIARPTHMVIRVNGILNSFQSNPDANTPNAGSPWSKSS